MLFYCEAINHKGLVVLDVHKLSDLKQWWFNREFEVSWNNEDTRSLIEINNFNWIKYRGPREGDWYDIPNGFWNECSFDFEKFSYDKEDRSVLFRLSVEFNGNEKVDFLSFKTEPLWWQHE